MTTTTTAMVPTSIDLPATLEAQGLVVARPPSEVLAEARTAAKALQDVISKKAKPVVFNGEQYLEFEDWQLIARFYGVSARVTATRYLELGGARGFEATADVINLSTGQVISTAEAMCLSDERTWANRPLFMVRSMAQTRACAKALRNVFGCVVVLAGYRATPSEELSHDEPAFDRDTPRQTRVPAKPEPEPAPDVITAKQRRELVQAAEAHNWQRPQVEKLLAAFKYNGTAEVKAEDFPALLTILKDGPQEH